MIFIIFGLPFLWIYLFNLMKKKILLKNTRPKQQPIIIEKSFSLPKNNFQYFFDILGWILLPLYPFSFFVAKWDEKSSFYKFLTRCDWKTRRRRSAYCIVMAIFCCLPLLLYGYYLEQTYNTFLFVTTIIILMVLKIKFLSVELKALNEEKKGNKKEKHRSSQYIRKSKLPLSSYANSLYKYIYHTNHIDVNVLVSLYK